MSLRTRRIAACAGTILAIAACSGSPDSQSTPASTAGAGLPPATLAGLAPIFDPQVKPLGLRVTRAALVSANTRAPSPAGTHLAIYVEPASPWSSAHHVEVIVPLARTLAPALFARWPGLESFDVCQEPSPGVDDRPEPPPVTTVDMTRAASEAIDWDTADLISLAVASARRADFNLSVSPSLGHVPALRSALEKAQAIVESGG